MNFKIDTILFVSFPLRLTHKHKAHCSLFNRFGSTKWDYSLVFAKFSIIDCKCFIAPRNSTVEFTDELNEFSSKMTENLKSDLTKRTNDLKIHLDCINKRIARFRLIETKQNKTNSVVIEEWSEKKQPWKWKHSTEARLKTMTVHNRTLEAMKKKNKPTRKGNKHNWNREAKCANQNEDDEGTAVVAQEQTRCTLLFWIQQHNNNKNCTVDNHTKFSNNKPCISANDIVHIYTNKRRDTKIFGKLKMRFDKQDCLHFN